MKKSYITILVALVASLLTLAGTSVLTSSTATAQDTIRRERVCADRDTTPNAEGECLVHRQNIYARRCPAGFSPSSDPNTCEKTVPHIYGCPAGSYTQIIEPVGNNCRVTNIYPPTYSYSCGAGGTLVFINGEWQCEFQGTTWITTAASSCEVINDPPAYQYPSGDRCIVGYAHYSISNPRCSAGWTFVFGVCAMEMPTTTYESAIRSQPNCGSGQFIGPNCQVVTTWATVQSCPSGSTESSNGRCIQTSGYIYQTPDCPPDYDETGYLPDNGIVCSKYEDSIPQPCPDGYEEIAGDPDFCRPIVVPTTTTLPTPTTTPPPTATTTPPPTTTLPPNPPPTATFIPASHDTDSNDPPVQADCPAVPRSSFAEQCILRPECKYPIAGCVVPIECPTEFRGSSILLVLTPDHHYCYNPAACYYGGGCGTIITAIPTPENSGLTQDQINELELITTRDDENAPTAAQHDTSESSDTAMTFKDTFERGGAYKKEECPTMIRPVALTKKSVAGTSFPPSSPPIVVDLSYLEPPTTKIVYQRPTADGVGRVTDSYWNTRSPGTGEPPNRFHRALDLGRSKDLHPTLGDQFPIKNKKVYPVLDGVVVRIGKSERGAGNNVAIDHGIIRTDKETNKDIHLISKYLHLRSDIEVVVNQEVRAKAIMPQDDSEIGRTVIGYVSNSGTIYPHLHLEIGEAHSEIGQRVDAESTIRLSNKFAPEDCLLPSKYPIKRLGEEARGGEDDPQTPTDPPPIDPPPTTPPPSPPTTPPPTTAAPPPTTTTLPPTPTTTTTTLPLPETEYVWPIDIPISSRGSFNLLRFRINERHEIKAIRNGRVIYVENCPRNRFTSYCLIRISHNTDESGAVLTGYYMISNSRFESRVKRHDNVTKGQIIGYVEPSNPESTNSIFSFRTFTGGGYSNPTNYLPERE